MPDIMHPVLENQLRGLIGTQPEGEFDTLLTAIAQFADRADNMATSGAAIGTQAAAVLRGLKPLLDAESDAYEKSERELKAADLRFRRLVGISSEWYWEQDAQYRFTVISTGVANATGRDTSHFIGKTRVVAFGGDPAAPEWIAHDRMLDRQAPFRDFEFHYRGRDGDMIYGHL